MTTISSAQNPRKCHQIQIIFWITLNQKSLKMYSVLCVQWFYQQWFYWMYICKWYTTQKVWKLFAFEGTCLKFWFEFRYHFFETICQIFFHPTHTNLKFEAEGLRICKNFEITRTIYSNTERSGQFLVTECFFNLFLEVSHI